jgi:hypothetical protein
VHLERQQLVGEAEDEGQHDRRRRGDEIVRDDQNLARRQSGQSQHAEGFQARPANRELYREYLKIAEFWVG